MNAVFTVGEGEQAELSLMGSERLQQVCDAPHNSLGYGLMRLVTKQKNWALSFRKQKRYGIELQKDALIPCVFTTSKLAERPDLLTECCSFLLCP